MQTALSNSLHSVWLVCVPIAAIGLLLAFALEERPLRRQVAPAAPPPESQREEEAASLRS